ncbi:MAG TPA: Crp/Fnr family transcriptional regulator [Candidatus Saccharimonadales bacterium]|nr:Crp/Fnr family transcriptional regulator [Candidatus Saccharimonadales bacterium]
MNDTQQKIAAFFEAYPLKSFDERQIIIRAGEDPQNILYVVEGRISQYDITPTGNEMVVNVFKPGAFFPMSSAINNTPNGYFFEASTAVTTRVAPAADVIQFIKDNPDVLFDLLARVYRGVDGVLRRMAHLMGGDAKSRLLFELLNASYRFGQPQPNGEVTIALTETALARHSGLARETINRTLKDLKTAGLIEVSQEGIVVKDPKRLAATLGDKL